MPISKIIRRVVVGIVTAVILWLGGSYLYFYADEHRGERLPVLLYHDIVERPGQETRYAITGDNLSEQLEWLKKNGYETITDHDLAGFMDGNASLPEKPILLTFDDDHRSHYYVAFPLLEKHDFEGVFFLATVRVGADVSVNKEQIREMSEAGMSMQSHTHGHALSLTSMPLDAAREQFVKSKEFLDPLTDNRVISLSLPGGKWDDNLRPVADATGFRLIFASKPGTNRLEDDMMPVRRIEVPGGTGAEDLNAKLKPSCQAAARLVYMLKQITKPVLRVIGIQRGTAQYAD